MSETENPKLDDMTFTDAAECCLELGRSLMAWRGDTYNLKDDRDIQRGIARQERIDRENARALAHIDHLEGILSKRIISDSGSQAADAPIAGRMTSEKPIGLLRIERHKNGGWLVDGRDNTFDRPHREATDVTGAFTSTADMLRALSDLLERDDEKRREQADG